MKNDFKDPSVSSEGNGLKWRLGFKTGSLMRNKF